MSFVDELVNVLAASANDIATRLASLGDQGTAGPSTDEHPLVDTAHPAVPCWKDGWWSAAKREPIHPARVGPGIRACCAVAHTTDMLPEEWAALKKRWAEQGGDGAGAHFGLGRSAAEGVVQWIPITRNGNHAGGPGHGVYRAGNGTTFHPNVLAVGIEIHCAGGVHLVDGAWRLVENGNAHGLPLPAGDVIPDPQRPGRGWHVVTEYQRTMLDALLGDLELVLAPMPAGLQPISTGELVPSWAVVKSARVCGHVCLDPRNRSDPWPLTMQHLRSR